MRDFHPGGTYADAHPSGAKTVLMPDGVLTHQGLIPYDGGTRPLYVRLFPEPFKFAGQASNRFGTMVYDGQWHLDPRIATGTSGCIFDRDGVLRIIEPGPGVTSGGYRNVAADGRLILGDATYGPFHGLTEYTDLGDGVYIGQGEPGGGVRVWDGATLRELEPGSCTFIRATRVGELVAIAFSTPGGAVIWQTSMGVLRTLPPADVHRVPGPIIINDEPKKAPTIMRLPDEIQTIVQTLYDRNRALAHGDDDQRRALTRKIVEQVEFSFPGQGYGWKSAHAHQVAPSKDSLAKQLAPFDTERPAPAGALISWDLFNGSSREPNDRPESTDIPGQYFIPIVGVNHLGSAPPAPDPQKPAPAGVDLSDILRRLEKLEGPRKVAIRTHNGHFYCAEGGGGGEVNATRTAAGPWEEVTLEPR